MTALHRGIGASPMNETVPIRLTMDSFALSSAPSFNNLPALFVFQPRSNLMRLLGDGIELLPCLPFLWSKCGALKWGFADHFAPSFAPPIDARPAMKPDVKQASLVGGPSLWS